MPRLIYQPTEKSNFCWIIGGVIFVQDILCTTVDIHENISTRAKFMFRCTSKIWKIIDSLVSLKPVQESLKSIILHQL